MPYITVPPEKIAAWIDKHFPDRRVRKDTEYIICNPFDGDEDYKFNINVEKGVCHYWRGDEWAPRNPKTGKRNTGFLNFVKLYRKCSWQQAVREVIGTNSMLTKRKEREERVPDQLRLPAGSMPIVGSPMPQIAKTAAKWLKSRGITAEQIEANRIHHTVTDVVWPYYEYEALVYWQSRNLLNKRFLFPPQDVAGKDYFYGFDQAEPASHVIITEAIFCSLTLGEQAIASGGAVMGEKLVKKLRLLDPVDGVILAPDNDEPGIKSILVNAPLVKRLGYKVFYSIPPKLRLPDGSFTKDWNDLVSLMGREEIRSHLERGLTPFTRVSSAVIAGLLVGSGRRTHAPL